MSQVFKHTFIKDGEEHQASGAFTDICTTATALHVSGGIVGGLGGLARMLEADIIAHIEVKPGCSVGPH